MDSVHHIWCPLSSQEYQDLPDGAETTLTVTKEVPLKLAQLRERWERYVVLNAEWAARGRRGFERNPRDD